MSAADESAPTGRFEYRNGAFWYVEDEEVRFEPYLRAERPAEEVARTDDGWWDPEFAKG